MAAPQSKHQSGIVAETMELVETADDAAPLVDGVKTDYTDAPEGAGEGVGGAQRAAQCSRTKEPGTGRRADDGAYK